MKHGGRARRSCTNRISTVNCSRSSCLYSYFEVTEIFANVPNQPKPQNVFSIPAAENHAGIPGETVEYLNLSRIKLKDLWSAMAI